MSTPSIDINSPRTSRLSINLKKLSRTEKKTDDAIGLITSPKRRRFFSLRSAKSHEDHQSITHLRNQFIKDVKRKLKKEFQEDFDLSNLDQVHNPICLSDPMQIIRTLKKDPGEIWINQRTFSLKKTEAKGRLAELITLLTKSQDAELAVNLLDKPHKPIEESLKALLIQILNSKELQKFGTEIDLLLTLEEVKKGQKHETLSEPFKKLLNHSFSLSDRCLERKKEIFFQIFEAQLTDENLLSLIQEHSEYVWTRYLFLRKTSGEGDLPEKFVKEISRVLTHQDLKESIPTLSLLKAFSFCGWRFADQYIRRLCPALYATSRLSREDGKVYVEDAGSTNYRIWKEKEEFSVTHVKTYHFGSHQGSTGDLNLQGSIKIHWTLKGALKSDRYSASFAIKNMKLEEDLSINELRTICLAFGIKPRSLSSPSPRALYQIPKIFCAKEEEISERVKNKIAYAVGKSVCELPRLGKNFDINRIDEMRRPIYLGLWEDIISSFRAFWTEEPVEIKINEKNIVVCDYSKREIEEKERPKDFLKELIRLLDKEWGVKTEDSDLLFADIILPEKEKLSVIFSEIFPVMKTANKIEDLEYLIKKIKEVAPQKGLGKEAQDILIDLIENHAAYCRTTLKKAYDPEKEFMSVVLPRLFAYQESKKKNFPTLPILKAMNKTSFSIASSLLHQKVCPSLFPLEKKKEGELSLYLPGGNIVRYEIDLNENQKDFSVTQIRKYQICIFDDQLERDPFGSLDVRWTLRGKVDSDSYSAELTIPSLKFKENVLNLNHHVLKLATGFGSKHEK